MILVEFLIHFPVIPVIVVMLNWKIKQIFNYKSTAIFQLSSRYELYSKTNFISPNEFVAAKFHFKNDNFYLIEFFPNHFQA